MSLIDFFSNAASRTGILDIGCLNEGWFSSIIPALMSLVLLGLLGSLGRLASGKGATASLHPLSGWGIAVLVLMPLTIFYPGHLAEGAAVLGFITILANFAFWLKNKTAFLSKSTLALFGLQILALMAINKAGITGWDDIAHWNLNALFLWHHDSFPTTETPIYSAWPSYPYAAPLLTYLASLLNGVFIVQGGAMMSWLFLTVFAFALVNTPETTTEPRQKTTLFFLAFLLTTLFNPGFNPSFTITGQSDGLTSAATGLIGLLFLHIHQSFQQDDKTKTRHLTLQLSLSATALIQLRQMNIVIIGLLGFAFLCLAWRDKNLKKALLTLTIALLPVLLIRSFWNYYVTQNMGQSGFNILPVTQWHWHLIPTILHSIWLEVIKKNGLYALMIVSSGFGLFSFFRRRDALGTMAFLSAIVFAGQISFLFFSYLGSSFSEDEVKRAASFYRYSTHVSLLGTAVLWLALCPILQKHLNNRLFIAATASVFALLPLTYLLKPDWIIRQSRADHCDSRTIARFISAQMQPEGRLIVIDPKGNGFQNYIINYTLALDDSQRNSHLHTSLLTSSFGSPDNAQISAALEDRTNTLIFIERNNESISALAALGANNKTERSVFRHTENRWEPIPIPPDIRYNIQGSNK